MPIYRRRLPHRYDLRKPLFITFRLHGSLAPEREFLCRRLDSGNAFVCMDRLLEECRSGPTYLRLPAIAQIVSDQIREGANDDYELHTWVVMPNHCHLLISPRVEVPALLHRIKGISARRANQLLGQVGRPFWQEESYDHLVRDANEFYRIENYILQNPVRAGLAQSADQYPWCSAYTTLESGHAERDADQR